VATEEFRTYRLITRDDAVRKGQHAGAANTSPIAVIPGNAIKDLKAEDRNDGSTGCDVENSKCKRLGASLYRQTVVARADDGQVFVNY
jgi:hypothetical protein